MFKKIGKWFDKHPVIGKVVIFAGSYAAFIGFIALLCKVSNLNHPENWNQNDNFELYEGDLSDNLQKMREFLATLKMVPGEGYWIDYDGISNISLTQYLDGDEISIEDVLNIQCF